MNWHYFLVFAFFSFAMGATIASFINVCIYRIPRGESVVSPPSHCPNCNARIRWYQNIPIVSWCCLRGKCANCRQPISARYVAVELLGGVLFLLAYFQWATKFMLQQDPPLMMTILENPWTVAVEWLVIAGLILGSFIDLAEQWLPDRVTIGGMILGVPLSFLVPELQRETTQLTALYWSLGGMAFGFFFLWGVGALFSWLLHKDALGFGDVKLMGAVGAFFGPAAVLFTLVISSIVGSIAGGLLIWRGRARIGSFTAVPYGPFIAFGVLAWMYYGPEILEWYKCLTRY